MNYRYIGFKAFGIHEGKKYDCSFYVSHPLVSGITQEQVGQAIHSAVQQFHEYHPTGQIVGQMERIVNHV